MYLKTLQDAHELINSADSENKLSLDKKLSAAEVLVSARGRANRKRREMDEADVDHIIELTNKEAEDLMKLIFGR